MIWDFPRVHDASARLHVSEVQPDQNYDQNNDRNDDDLVPIRVSHLVPLDFLLDFLEKPSFLSSVVKTWRESRNHVVRENRTNR